MLSLPDTRRVCRCRLDVNGSFVVELSKHAQDGQVGSELLSLLGIWTRRRPMSQGDIAFASGDGLVWDRLSRAGTPASGAGTRPFRLPRVSGRRTGYRE